MKLIKAVLVAMLFGTLAVGTITLTGCKQEGPAEKVGEQIDDAADEAADAAKDAADEAKDAAEDVKDAAKDATN